MDEINFRQWLNDKGVKPKLQSDCISRLKRIERECKMCDLDEEYSKDECRTLVSAFAKLGKNDQMKRYEMAQFPIGKLSMNVYKHALSQYIQFKTERQSLE